MEGLAMKKGGMGRHEGKGDGPKLIANVIAELFAIRTYAHRAHLKTPSYSKHRALDTFYTDIVDLADNLAEAAQGLWGKLDIPLAEVKGDVTDPIGVMEEHIHKLTKDVKMCGKDFLDDIMQGIKALYFSTIYKMKELS